MSSISPQTVSAAEALSAVWDGQADGPETDLALAAYAASDEHRDRWRAYAAIRNVCQGASAAAHDPSAVTAIMAALDDAGKEAAPRPAQAVRPMSVAAANDSVWRWKLAAGVLATVAVASTAWGLLGSSASDERLVAAPVQPERADDQRMIRNPELEALLAQHRQHGGVSVIQVSSGFLRNATYEVPADR